MPELHWDYREHLALGRYMARWVALVVAPAAATGSAVALFLWALDRATRIRWDHPGLLWLLPLAGIAIVLAYRHAGKGVERGNNLIMDEIHEPGGGGVPLRMAPLVLIATVVTHLFGGSAGREGTAVQMGGSIFGAFSRWLKLSEADTRVLLMAGIAAGFGAVFGTPLTGAVFALEVLAIGRLRYDAIVPCLAAAIIGDQSCLAWGTPHTHYRIDTIAMAAGGHLTTAPGVLLTLKVILASAAFGLASVLFVEVSHSLAAFWKKAIAKDWLRPVAGALVVIALAKILRTEDYLGLGVRTATGEGVSIVNAFSFGGAGYASWFWKLLFTAITLSCGFKGGEVTPLFFIGATLGHALALVLGAPVDLFAGLGFIAVFAGATNTPLACTIMGIELFGGEHTLLFAIACFGAYLFSGHRGIYAAQRLGIGKGHGATAREDISLAELRAKR